jgi:DNA-directed RNA polymerase subunit M/transcription elongation factor TFIIS
MRCIWKIAYHTANKNNKTIIESILNNEGNFSKFAMMSDAQLDPKEYEPIIKAINRSRNVVFSQKTSKMYKCAKCKQRKCKIENIYNRGLDEGVNLKITCMECSHHWFG